MRKRSERVESSSTLVTEQISGGYFCLDPVFFSDCPLGGSGGYHLERCEMPLHDAVGINC